MLHKLRSLNRHRAFTLVELLMVIAIIGVLTVALLPQVRSAQGKARDSSRQAVINNIATAIEARGSVPAADAVAGGCLNFASGAGLAIIEQLRAAPKSYTGGGVTLCGGGYFYQTFNLAGAPATTNPANYVVVAELEIASGNMYGVGVNGAGTLVGATTVDSSTDPPTVSAPSDSFANFAAAKDAFAGTANPVKLYGSNG